MQQLKLCYHEFSVGNMSTTVVSWVDGGLMLGLLAIVDQQMLH